MTSTLLAFLTPDPRDCPAMRETKRRMVAAIDRQLADTLAIIRAGQAHTIPTYAMAVAG
jgi:hypothetical protein